MIIIWRPETGDVLSKKGTWTLQSLTTHEAWPSDLILKGVLLCVLFWVEQVKSQKSSQVVIKNRQKFLKPSDAGGLKKWLSFSQKSFGCYATPCWNGWCLRFRKTIPEFCASKSSLGIVNGFLLHWQLASILTVLGWLKIVRMLLFSYL